MATVEGDEHEGDEEIEMQQEGRRSEAVEKIVAQTSEASADGAVIESLLQETAVPQHQEPRPNLKAKTLLDRSLYRGHLDDESQPHGLGLVYPALGTHIYAGEFHHGHKEGVGVQLLPNGTMYAGEFHHEYASGYGVKRDPFGSQFIGEWSEGELHGVGLSVSMEGDIAWGHFHLNELDDTATGSAVDWQQAQQSVLRAMLAEQNAIQAQERARQAELQVVLQSLTTIEATYFESEEEISSFTGQEDRKLKEFLAETQQQYREVEAEADRWKFQEAQLKEKQKNLRREINEKRTELSYLTKYVGIAEERQAQVADAEQTLQVLHRQIESLKAQVLKTSNEQQLSERKVEEDQEVNQTPEAPHSQREEEDAIPQLEHEAPQGEGEAVHEETKPVVAFF